MPRLLAAALVWLLAASLPALAQPGPGPPPSPWVVNGNQTNPGSLEVVTTPSLAGSAGFNIPYGTAPTSCVNGDMWTTSAGLFVCVGATPVGPLASSASATLVVGSSVITSGTTKGLLYNNGGVLGNLATANNGVMVTSGTGVPSVSTTLPSGLTAPNFSVSTSLTVTGAFTATGLVTNADLANPSVTVNGTTCTLGASCAPGTALLVGSSPIVSGTANGLLFDNGGTLGNLATASNSVLVTSGAGVPSLAVTLPAPVQANITATGTLSSGFAGSGYVVGPVTMNLGADALGDMYYRGASGVLTRLPVGSSGQILGVAAGLPAWQTGGGGSSAGSLLPQGRLTLTSATPVPTANVSGAPAVLYDCYKGGNTVWVWNGTSDVPLTIESCEITTGLASSISLQFPNVYDVWAFNNSGALAICWAGNNTAAGWSSDVGGSNTGRGTGYTALDSTTRPYVTNKNALSNCFNGTGATAGAGNHGTIAANQATYLGTVCTDPSAATFTFNFGSSAAGGGAARLCVWNNYNAVLTQANVNDSTASWTYSTTTVRSADGSANNSVTFVSGQKLDAIYGLYYVAFIFSLSGQPNSPGQFCIAGTSLDTNTAINGTRNYFSTQVASLETFFAGNSAGWYPPQVGLHTLYAVEQAGGAYPCSYAGGTTSINMAVQLAMPM